METSEIRKSLQELVKARQDKLDFISSLLSSNDFKRAQAIFNDVLELSYKIVTLEELIILDSVNDKKE